MSDNRATELESLSKLKTAGRLHYWRGTIEIPESELHAICDEIQDEHDNAIHALNKAAGNWAKVDDELRELSEIVFCKDCEYCNRNLWSEIKRGIAGLGDVCVRNFSVLPVGPYDY